MNGFDDFQKIGTDGFNAVLENYSTLTKGMQAIAIEVADYSKKSFEDGSAALEKMMGAKSLDKAFEVQTDYVKKAYDAHMAEMTKIGGLYSDLAKDVYKPFEAMTPKGSK